MVEVKKKRASPVFAVRWLHKECARCGQTFKFLMRTCQRKVCDDCQDMNRLEKQRIREEGVTRIRVRTSRPRKNLIRYAGYDGTKTPGWD